MQLSRGFALVEVLVALLLTAWGLQAWLQAQALALQQTRVQQHRSVALMLALDLAEVLRASPAFAPAMAHEGRFGIELPPSPAACQVGRCEAAAWAAADLARWRQQVRQNLPQGSSLLEIDAVARRARITVGWRELSLSQGPSARPVYWQCPAAWSEGTDDAPQCLRVEASW